jgi:hypothetical protein
MDTTMGNEDQTLNLDAALKRAGNPRVAASQRLRRLLHEVSMRSRCGAMDAEERRSLVDGLCEGGPLPEALAGGD